jgi:hypothetical protein
MDKWVAQQRFWSSFGIPAYDEQTFFTKGDQPSYPHIKYQSFGGGFDQTATLSASLWYRSSSLKDIKEKADEIQKFIGGGVTITTDEGMLWMKPPTTIPFAQPMDSGSNDENIKRIMLTVEAEFDSAY